MLFQPESPRFLASRSLGKAEEALKYFRACENVGEEFEGIEEAVEEDSRPSLLDKIREIWQARKAFVIGGGLLFFQQISGQPAVLYFAPTIFTNAGLGAQASKFASVLGKKLFSFSSVVFFLFLQKKTLLLLMMIFDLFFVTDIVLNSWRGEAGCDDCCQFESGFFREEASLAERHLSDDCGSRIAFFHKRVALVDTCKQVDYRRAHGVGHRLSDRLWTDILADADGSVSIASKREHGGPGCLHQLCFQHRGDPNAAHLEQRSRHVWFVCSLLPGVHCLLPLRVLCSSGNKRKDA